MTHLIKSYSLNFLMNNLAEKLCEHTFSDPLKSNTIIVPNHETANRLKLFIAEKNGIAANLTFMLPGEWQWMQVRKVFPDVPKVLVSDIEPMKWAIFELLMVSKIRKSFPALERYISAHHHQREDIAALQLASQIAAVFDQYLNHRPGMMLKWQSGRGETDPVLSWQPELWKMLCERWRLNGEENNLHNKAELFSKTLDAISRGDIAIEETLFVFNTGLIPKPVISFFRAAGKHSNLFLFLIQPSDRLENPGNELLISFGEESKKIIQLYKPLDDTEETLSDIDLPDTLLGKVRQSTILNKSIKSIHTREKPDTIQIRSCHSSSREVETLHQFLLELFERDNTLAPDDILVATPDLETYAPYIQAVFGNPEKNLPAIPYHLASLPKKNEFELALNQLLDIAGSRFHFNPVMDFFSIECVCGVYGVSESEAALVKLWMKENHVIWGMNSEHRSEFDQPKNALQTWQTALYRGWMGQWVGENSGFQDETFSILYQGVQSRSQQETWAAFSFFLNQLNEIRKQVKTKRSVSGWFDWLQSTLPNFITEKLRTSVEGTKVIKAIEALSESSILGGCETMVSFSLFRNEINKRLERKGAAGARFTGGITFSSMVPVRSIPFRVVALIGLNDETFPRKQATSDFDLMARQPLEGERNRKQEDRNLFLESILAAQDVHYCSYIGQSQTDNDAIPPSSVVSEWIEMVALASGIRESEVVVNEALTGFSPTAFRERGSFSEYYYRVSKEIQQGEAKVEGFEQSELLAEPEGTRIILVNELARFFKNPSAFFLKKRFGVYFEEPDEVKDEFQAGFLDIHILFQKVLRWMLSGKRNEEIIEILSASGILPIGWPGEKIKKDLIQNAQLSIQSLNKIGFNPIHKQIDISFELNSNKIEGLISTYSNDFLLELTPSGRSGGNLIQCWIRHLCMLQNGGAEQSWYIYNLKEGIPKMIRFDNPGNTADLLKGLLELYNDGIQSPLYFFPKTLTEYCESDESKREQKARIAFEGAFSSFGDRENVFIQTLLGPEVSFSHDLLKERFIAVIESMVANMREEV